MDIHEALYTTRMMRRLRPDPVPLGVPVEEGWRMSAMLTLGYPRGRWGVAANRRPVHEVSSRNRWDAPFGVEVPQPLWSPRDEAAGLAAVG